jgi:FAD-linked sulfhydryl oxidase
MPFTTLSLQDSLGNHPVFTDRAADKSRAELGQASWKLFHTMMARFPDKPTEDEQTALLSYIHLFARLYPCGECAGHFRQILEEYPPQVRTRSAAAVWACHVHNEVNKSLKKPLFDCAKIGDFYDCGCAEEEKKVCWLGLKGCG